MRGETAALLDVLATELVGGDRVNKIPGRCLQLGLGECRASHEVWRCVFDKSVVTLDWGAVLVNDGEFTGTDVSTLSAVGIAAVSAPYDFLFIDAGHTAEDARRDHTNYGPLVRPGGIIAFHDALLRPGFEDAVRVWEYLASLNQRVNVIGSEVGVAWIRRI